MIVTQGIPQLIVSEGMQVKVMCFLMYTSGKWPLYWLSSGGIGLHIHKVVNCVLQLLVQYCDT